MQEVADMKLEANVNFDRFEGALQVVDSHTVGEFCRIVIGGFPEPEGNTMIEKKKWMEENYDHVRTALMFEPRGHHDMFGAFLCEPVNPEAQFGTYVNKSAPLRELFLLKFIKVRL